MTSRPGSCSGPALGLAALFLYLDTTSSSTTGVSVTVLFGSLFAIDRSLTRSVALLGLVALGTRRSAVTAGCS